MSKKIIPFIVTVLVIIYSVMFVMLNEQRTQSEVARNKVETVKRVCKDMTQAYPQTDLYGECVIRNSVVN